MQFIWQSHRPLRVLLIGAGGNGSETADGLLKIHLGLQALVSDAEGQTGLEVIIMDDKVVASHNCVRQRYWPHEIGVHKAIALSQRSNVLLGTNWQGLPRRFNEQDQPLLKWCDIVMTAVDTVRCRQLVHQMASELCAHRKFWLDMGVEKDQGQIVFGDLTSDSLQDPLPNVVAHYPEILHAPEQHQAPSCNAAESLARQDLFLNETAGQIACQLLWQTIRTGRIARNVVCFNLTEGWQQGTAVCEAVT